MTTYRLATRVLLALGISACATATTAWAQEAPNVREAPGVEDVRQLLVAAYPELLEGRVSWRVTTTATGLVVEAHRVELPFAPLPPMTAALVTGTAVVDQDGRLESLTAGGTVLDSLRQKAAALTTRGRQGVDEVLKREGAKFAPDTPEEETAKLVPAGVRTVLKTPVARAHTFRSDPPPDRAKEALTWQIELEGGDASAAAFTVVFEPIEGRLMSVVRR